MASPTPFAHSWLLPPRGRGVSVVLDDVPISRDNCPSLPLGARINASQMGNGSQIIAERPGRIRPLGAVAGHRYLGPGFDNDLGQSQRRANLVTLGTEARPVSVIAFLPLSGHFLLPLVDLLMEQDIGYEAKQALWIVVPLPHIGMRPSQQRGPNPYLGLCTPPGDRATVAQTARVGRLCQQNDGRHQDASIICLVRLLPDAQQPRQRRSVAWLGLVPYKVPELLAVVAVPGVCPY